MTSAVEPDDHVLGEPDAPVTVMEYGDYECPYCAAAAPVLKRLVKESDGRVRLVFRNFPLADVHPYALTAALAAEAAGAQGQFWPMHYLLFRNQDRLTDADLGEHAASLGLDPDSVVGEAAQAFAGKVQTDFTGGLEIGVRGTPWILVGGVHYEGPVKLEELREATSGGVGDGLAPREGRQRERRGLLGFRRAQR